MQEEKGYWMLLFYCKFCFRYTGSQTLLFIKSHKSPYGRLATTGGQDGYGAFTYGVREKDLLIEYVKNQEVHHRNISFREEYMRLL
ncbi:MAG: hypothetical protein M3421_00475, partial [Bacteroidota bacterium]|nr:hypothetical protein [Bacteroidota bacterium]